VGGAFAESAARVAGGIGIVACAAVVALAAGGGTLFGGLGGLFGAGGSSLQVARDAAPQSDLVAAPTAAERSALARHRTIAFERRAAHRRQTVRGHGRTRSKPPRKAPGAPPPAGGNPAPAPVPSLPPPPQPAPSPGGGQVATTVAQTVQQIASQAPPAVQPITDPIADAVGTLVQTCVTLPACP
jgi:hypothetical protein